MAHKSILTAENPYGTSARDTLVGYGLLQLNWILQ